MTRLEALAVEFGLDEAAHVALGRYVDLIHGWSRGNLTGLHERDQIVEILLADSLALLDVPQLWERTGAGWLDLGAGAGIPGIPLAVAVPSVEVVLLEATARKCAFFEEAAVAADLGGRARVVCARSEAFAAPGASGREAASVVLARAVAPLPVLIELAAPLLALGGALLASKTRRAIDEEGPAAERAAELCGLRADVHVPLPRSSLIDAVCSVYRKIGPTPARFPRREGMAAKRPLAS